MKHISHRSKGGKYSHLLRTALCALAVSFAGVPTISIGATNLLVNGNAELGGMNSSIPGWVVTANGGNGWRSFVRCGEPAFQTSYGWDKRYQVIDLLAAGFTAGYLDSAPDINVSEDFRRYLVGCQWYLTVELRGASGNVIASWTTGTKGSAGIWGWGACDNKVRECHTFSNYGAGVRYVYFYDGGKDTAFWAGWYGVEITNGRVYVGDPDGDGVAFCDDNCPVANNPDQGNGDGDIFGDACDDCPNVSDDNNTIDSDADGVGTVCDNCPAVSNPDQADNDGDGLGDACDPDDDNDGVADESDNCPVFANPGQDDCDGDGIGDACDEKTDLEAVCGIVGGLVDAQYPPTAYRNHGKYVSAVAQLADGLIAGFTCLNDEQREDVHSCVVSQRAKSDVGKPTKAK